MMRNSVIIALIIIWSICGIILFGTSYRLDTDDMLIPYEVSQSLLGDLSFVRNNEETSLEVSFSHEDFFYDQTINVTITANEPAVKIYYTTDGSLPTRDSSLFTGPINFTAEENVKCIVLKAVAIDDSNSQSPILTHSYFIGLGIDERFSTYVISISSDPEGLCGDDKGILVSGKGYDDFVEQNPDANFRQAREHNNYMQRGREWERAAHIEVITQSGERVISQNAGLRVHGGYSRSFPQKSLRLIARQEYEPGAGRFDYVFFKEKINFDVFEWTLSNYDTIILRNDGNDFNKGRLRNPLMSQIIREAGFDMISPSTATAVFINGVYYGYADLNVRIDEKYLESLSGIPEQNFQVLEGGNHRLYHIDEETEEVENKFKQLLEYAKDGFFDEDELNMLHDFFDVDNLLFYYAIQSYIGNVDWPRNNVKIWRYTGAVNEKNPLRILDGRFRYVLYDLDQGMGFEIGSRAEIRSIHRILDDDNSPIFRGLAINLKYVEIFANYICDLANEHFSVENVSRIIDELNHKSLREQKKSLILYEKDYDEFLKFREAIIEFAEKRPSNIIAEMGELYGFKDMYSIISDGTVKINTLNGNKGSYFIRHSVPVTPILEEGQVFEYWLVNGEKRYDEDMKISFEDADDEGIVYVRLITREKTDDEWPPLIFLTTYDTGELFGFTMYNPTDISRGVQGLYLSDDIDNLKRWAFPSINVRAGSTLDFVGQNVTAYDALLKIGLNFNPRQGEVIYLSNDKGEILDYIEMLP